MRIVFVGASELSLACLQSLGPVAEICGIITAPRQFRISYAPDKVTNIRHVDLRHFGGQHAIPVYEMQDAMTEPALLAHLAAWRPDFLLVAGWYHMVPRKVRALAPMGAAGIHASLLPRYSGGAPLVWAMINQEQETGITFFYLEDGVDNGDIIAQQRFAIAPTDTIADLLEKTRRASISILHTHLPLLAAGRADRQRQDESRRTVFPQRSPADGKIDWQQPATALHSFIRAQTRPYPGAFGLFRREKLTIWAARPIALATAAPVGAVVAVNTGQSNLFIQAGGGEVLALQTVQWQGEEMDTRRFIAASGIRAGELIA